MRKVASIKSWVDDYDAVEKGVEDLRLMPEFVEAGLATEAEMDEHYRATMERIEALELRNMLRGEEDKMGAIMDINAGAGGTEACDWTSMLYRMYCRYCEQQGFKVTELDFEDGDEAGLKSVSFKVDGENAYGFLKAEKGVHRLVRISPFDSNKRRHTSFASLEVMPEVDDAGEVEIRDEDIRIDVYRSSGAGGQKVKQDGNGYPYYPFSHGHSCYMSGREEPA